MVYTVPALDPVGHARVKDCSSRHIFMFYSLELSQEWSPCVLLQNSFLLFSHLLLLFAGPSSPVSCSVSFCAEAGVWYRLSLERPAQ